MNEEQAAKNITYEQFVVFALDNEEYAIPILDVREILKSPEITAVPNSEPYVAGVINLRGKVIPIIDLEKKFNLVHQENYPLTHTVITEQQNGSLMGFRVDQVRDVVKISTEEVKPAPNLLQSHISSDYVKGVFIINKSGVERIVLILDITKLILNLSLPV